jgi:arabinose-5-phosphate isomerase
MEDTITAISTGGNGCVAVVDETDKFLGMVTDGDLRRAMTENFLQLTAGDIMTASPMTLSKSMRMSRVIDIFTSRRVSNAFIVEDGKPIGVIHMKTLLKEGYV